MTPNTPTPAATAPAGQVHTPTPWSVNGWDVVAQPSVKWHVVAKATKLEYDATDNERWANAAHIVHCVNTHSQLLAQNAALLAQREELLGLICKAVAFGDIEFDTWRGFVQRCEEAIANASKVSP